MTDRLIDNNPFKSGLVEFRSFDGSNNNLNNNEWGSVDSPLLNIIIPDYGDRISSPAGEDRPNPRTISNKIANQTTDIPSEKGLTNTIWGFGQFVSHDLDLVGDSETSANIPVPAGDFYLDPANTGSVTIPMKESEYIAETGTDINNPRQISNKVTSWLDGSNIYGSDEARARALRVGGGKLRVSGGNLLPFNSFGLENDNPRGVGDSSLFLAGDVRANENSVLASMHTLFVREHNRLAELLAVEHPDWGDEQIFQRAREINIAQYQNIVYNEYLPALLGEDRISQYQGYKSSANPDISRVFANAAFRLGHSQLSSEILRLDSQGNNVGSLTLANVFFQSVSTTQQAGIDPILRGVSSSLSQEIDTKTIDDVRNLLFGFGAGAIGRDLFAININRGRLNGLADYNTVRQGYGLSKINSFSEITSNTQLMSDLQALYGTVDNIDPIVGMLAEDKIGNAAVGETLSRVISKQFTSVRDGDRFYYENTFSKKEIEEIENVTLTDIIRRNTDTEIIQDNAFSLTNSGTKKDDMLRGGLAADTIDGGDGKDSIFGYSANDLLMGNKDKDLIFGGEGNDTISGGDDDDELFGEDGDDKLMGDEGKDNLVGGAGNDELTGDDDRDILVGGDGDDTLIGGEDKDELRGGNNNDILDGGEGKDTLFGGAGSDRFVLKLDSDKDYIEDYEDGSDKFVLSNILQFSDLGFKDKGRDVEIQVRENKETIAIVKNSNSVFLDVSDFIFD